MNSGAQARRRLASHRAGMLSTLSRRHGGHPFGSLVPYVLDHDGKPVILASRLAEHTRNIEADSRVSLLVHEEAPDPQAGARVTLLGNAAGLDVSSPAAARYQRFFKDSGKLLALGDFSFFAVTPLAIRCIEGFGSIHWIPAADYAPPPNSLAAAEADILTHMNSEHACNLSDYCRYARGKKPSAAVMVGLDCDGFDVRADDELVRFQFEHPLTSASEARTALVALAKASRTA